MRTATLQDLDPSALNVAVHLQPVERIRVHSRIQPQRHAGQHRARDDFDHGHQVIARERTLRDPPQIELMRLADVQPVDRVPPIGQAGAREYHVLVTRRCDHAQRARNHRRGLRTQQQLRRQVPRVAGIARCAVGWVAQGVVIVGRWHQRRRAVHHDGTAPRRPQSVECVLHEQLHRVRAERSVREIAQRQQATVGQRIEKLRSHSHTWSVRFGARPSAADESEPPDRFRRSRTTRGGLKRLYRLGIQRTTATPDAWNRPGSVNRTANRRARMQDMARM